MRTFVRRAVNRRRLGFDLGANGLAGRRWSRTKLHRFRNRLLCRSIGCVTVGGGASGSGDFVGVAAGTVSSAANSALD